jgi:arsenate reductase-like glutaredoxin family protein
MRKNKWLKSEVISYLEEKILEDKATDEEMEFYEKYIWFGKFNRKSDTYKRLLREMKEEWEGDK